MSSSQNDASRHQPVATQTDTFPPRSQADVRRISTNIGAPPPRWDEQVRTLAGLQGGHVTRQQLAAAGMPPTQIDYRVRVGRLVAVYNGVYALGHVPTRPEARACGALLACGERSALSHRSAATVWGIYPRWREPFELTAATHRRPAGVVLHHSMKLLKRDVTTRDDLRVTSPARTLLDISPRLHEKRRERVYNELRLSKLVDLTDIDDILARNPRHAGTPLLRGLLENSQEEPTRSDLEDAFLDLLRQYQLPVPAINVHVAGNRVDALFGDPSVDHGAHALIVELDGWLTHKPKAAFVHDRRQDREILRATGVPTIRLPYSETTSNAAEAAELLSDVLHQRGIWTG